VRIGNAAAGQFQLDVYGEVMSALYESEAGSQADSGSSPTWAFQLSLMDFLRDGWREPDDGIWEVRGPRRHFTHSKVMAWVAIDRAIKTAEEYGRDGPVDSWKEIRQEIHDQVCEEGFNANVGSFTQYYGSDQLDASLLMIPLVGFLPAQDPRVRGTIEAVERDLVEGGFVLRYRTDDTGNVDGLSGREGSFLACSFWLADCLTLLGRNHDARQMLDRLLGLRNDLGLLSEEYDAVAGRLVGNFPQAFSHVSLVNSASKLAGEEKPTTNHVIQGLARRAMSQGKSSGRQHHMGGLTAQGMLTRLSESIGADRPGSAARVIKAAVDGADGKPVPAADVKATRAGRGAGSDEDREGVAASATSKGLGKPTAKASAKRPARMVAKAPLRVAAEDGAKRASAKKASAKRTSARKAAKKKSAPGTAKAPRSARSVKATTSTKASPSTRAGKATKAAAFPKSAKSAKSAKRSPARRR
jgi:hypothetical protein